MLDEATRRAAEDLGDALLPLDPVVTPMFGGYCYYIDGKVVGLVCDGRVFVKRSSRDDLLAPVAVLAPAYPGAKDTWRLPAGYEAAEPDRVREIVAAVADALPARKR